MNKYWKFLVDSACESRKNAVHTILSFSQACPVVSIMHLLRQAKNVEPFKNSANSCVKVFDDYCIKSDNRPAIKRFGTKKLRIDPLKGVGYVTGEAVNTLVANKIQFPAHKLLALEYRYFERRSTLIFERIHGKPAFELINNIQPVTQDYFEIIFRFLHQSLLKGIFHGDNNLNNIFFDENWEQGIFVDLAFAFKLNSSVEEGLALQLATIGTSKNLPCISMDEYQNLVLHYLSKNFSNSRKCKNLFLEFHDRKLQNRNWKTSQCRVANLGKPDILLAL